MLTINPTVSLFYEILGQGEPVLLIHGFMGTGRSEFPTLLPWLAKRYQVIAPDLRGYGQSTPKPRVYGVDFYEQDARDMVALLEAHNLKNVVVMGYSDGGEVALWLPLLAPNRIRGVITWGATGHFSPKIKPAVLSMLSMGWHTPETDRLHGAQYVAEMTHHWVHAMTQIIDRGGDITFSRASEFQCPVLMCAGDRDALNPVENARAMATAIPQGTLSVYSQTGHAVHDERPRRFRREVERFIKRLPA